MGTHTPTSPVPAYEANPTQLPETHSTTPIVQDTAGYGPAAGQQQSGMTHNSYFQNTALTENKYPHQAVSPLSSPVQQPQGMMPVKQEYYTPEQPQMQQLHPQQQQTQQLPPQQQQQQYQQQPLQQQQQQYQQTYQTAIPLQNLQEASAPVDCPVCRHRSLTVVEKVSGNTTHLWAALACLVFFLGCVPYLISGLKDSEHKCGHCGVLLARWHKSGRTVVLQHA